MSSLAEILQAEVGAEIEGIAAEADSQAAKIISEAKSHTEEQIAVHKKKLAAETHAATQRAQSAADLSVASARTQARGEVSDLLWQKVHLALEEIASQANFGEILQSLADEAMQVAEKAAAVVVNPDDQDKLKDWARQQGLELRTDPNLHLGVRLVGQRGNATENTLPERLRRAWGTLGPEVSKILWE
jgi:V/A-type H+/Na+-transporting ATPase subunit E